MGDLVFHSQLESAQASIIHVDSKKTLHDMWPLLWAGHFVLGLIFDRLSILTTAHGVVTLAVCASLVLLRPSRNNILNCMMYVAGSEVLWRMGRSSLPWEVAKYALLGLILMVLWHERNKHIPHAVVLFVSFLLPSAVGTILSVNLDIARQVLASNLLGPLLLAVTVWFSQDLSLNRVQWTRALHWLIAPLITTGAYVLSKLLGSSVAIWLAESNLTASGGFGPNQVSMVLGLGAVGITLLILTGKKSFLTRLCYLGIAIWLMTQAALTFSRAGVVFGAVTIMIAAVLMLRRRFWTVVVLSMITMLVVASILPLLLDYTQSALELRFTDTNWTNRDQIALQELQLFIDTFPSGTGAGIGSFSRQSITGGDRIAAHFEYTRLLAEHGVLGVFLNLLIVWIALKAIFQSRGPENRATVVSLLAWSMLMMLGNATRVAAITFLFGLASAHFCIGSEGNHENEDTVRQSIDGGQLPVAFSQSRRL